MEAASPFDHVVLDTIKVWRDTFNKLHLELEDGTSCNDVRVVSTFPLTAPHTCVVVEDAEGREIGTIGSLDKLDKASRSIIEEELALEHYVSAVLAIHDVKSTHGMSTWDFQTDRGRRTVHVKERSDIRVLPGGRVLFTDAHGMRYEIPGGASLDERSRALLDSEM